jgi:capsular exopolysaccharide synthesis family protein
MRQPVQHMLFQLPIRHGLTDLLYAPKMDVTSQLQDTDVAGLKVLPVGTLPPPHPSELLGSARMGELLDRLAEQADIVLCDSAYAVAIADTLVLSAHVDGVVLVVEMGKTRRGIAEQAVQNLRQAGANVLGTILSPLPADKVATSKLKTLLVPGSASSTV